MVVIDDILNEKEALYIFGYGSLTWKPDFEFDRQIIGYIKGYEKRFWQASTYHRGTIEKPGRCLTLTRIDESVCWGVIFEIRGPLKIAKALDYLNIREQKLGGYEVYIVPTYPKNKEDVSGNIYSVVYVATADCDGFLGGGPISLLANDIATSIGKIGHNIEYLFRCVDFMRENLPDVEEKHMYALDKAVREIVNLPTDHILPWKQLLLDPSFRRLVKPIDYKAKWKSAILDAMNTPSIDRWTELLKEIQKQKEGGISPLVTANLGKSVFQF